MPEDPVPAVQTALAQLNRGGESTPTTSSVGSGTDGSAGRTTGWEQRAERRFVRVAVDHLDALMEIAGELVTARSRLMGRVSSLRNLQNDLRSSHARLDRVVGGFNERHEFSLRQRGSDHSPAGRTDGTNSTENVRSGFGELELDVYDDVNILSRQISEISDDVSEVQRSISSVLEAVNDDGRTFTTMVGELQGRVTTARMIPAQTLFDRLRMPIRDAAVIENKEVAVAVEGGATALDKGMIDGLYAPLLHLVRNAVAHGIESPAMRARIGKDRRGTVTITAAQEAGQVVITVKDDGGGLDLDHLRRLGQERGLIRPDASLREISELIFVSGLSTRETVDELAGRGVGGDVVRRDIERLGGRVQVVTERGRGTIFTMTLPLTMAIARALIVREGDRRYAIPVAFITRIVALADDPSVTSEGIIIGGDESAQRHCVAWTPLSALLHQPVVSSSMAVVMRVGTNLAAVSVEAVLGQDEIVIKPMEGILAGNPAVVGLTIDPSGDILPVLDAPGIIDLRSRNHFPVSSLTIASARHVSATISARSRRRVLFVDDSTSVRKVAEKFLVSLNVDAVFAVDGADAYSKLGADVDFDLVFTDLEMPRMNGFDLIRDLRRARRFDHLPIVVITSRTGRKHREQAAQLGADDYLTKPFNQDILAETLNRLVGSRRPVGAR
jgi:chemosensory pili system protein ChpA (sensor histidine kinase/response regulator)